jgi:Glycosyltransferase
LKILQVSDAYYPFPGGVSEHIHSLSKYLRKRGHEVWVLTTSYGNGDENFKEYVHRIGRVLILPLNKSQITLTFDPILPLKVWKFLRERSFDVVHTHGPLAPNLPGWATLLSPYPVVSTFHTSFVGFNWYKVARVFLMPVWKKIRVAIAVSKTAKDIMVPYFKGNYEIIPNGVDTERFKPEGEKHRIYSEIKGKTILFVGRLEPRKGPDLLLRAFVSRWMDFEKENVHLIFAGEGPLKEMLKSMVPENLKGRIHFLGMVPFEELPKLYRGADVYTSPAIGGETFGLVLIEAMASGVPVVAGYNEGYINVIEDGENGLLSKVKDPNDYAEALLRVLRDKNLRRKLIENGLKTASKYSWENVAKKVEEVYLRVLDRN